MRSGRWRGPPVGSRNSRAVGCRIPGRFLRRRCRCFATLPDHAEMAMAVIAEICAGARIKTAKADAAGPVPLRRPGLGPVIRYRAAIDRSRPVIPVTIARSRRINVDSAAMAWLRENSTDDRADGKACKACSELIAPVVMAVVPVPAVVCLRWNSRKRGCRHRQAKHGCLEYSSHLGSPIRRAAHPSVDCSGCYRGVAER